MSLFETETINIFGFWSGLLILKLIAVTFLTVSYRLRKKVFANPGDTKFMKESTVALDDPDVERIRRVHLNDLENIVPWFLSTYIWLGTGPSKVMAGILIRGFVISRICHTLVYAVYPQQPLRAICFLIGVAIILYQTIAIIIHYC